MQNPSHSGKHLIGLSKVNPPRLPSVVERRRLYRLLDRAFKRPVVWISAPPGFGKTTLAASYLRARRLRNLWYQVDDGDRDLATFFHYLGLAARQAAPRYRQPLPHLTPEYLLGVPTFTRRFFENFYHRLTSPTALVLDNYQEVPSDAFFHEMVSVSIETIPVGINMVVISRTLPPPSFARLQATQCMSFIDQEALRLTKSETRAIVRLHRKSQPTKATFVDMLHSTLHGWVAGLVLQLEQTHAPSQNPPLAQQEIPQVIFDYLAREVLQELSPQMQNFLLRTAFLPDMTGMIAAKLTGEASAGEILEGLYESRHFTERRAGSDSLYQYHPLFREFLRTRAKEHWSTSEVSAVQRTAAALLEETDRTEEAVALYAEAGQISEIVRLVQTRGPELLQQGRNQTLEAWLERVPGESYRDDPWLHYWLGACRMPTTPLKSEAHFEDAFRNFSAKGDQVGMLMAAAGIVSTMQFSWIDISRFDPWIDTLLRLVSPHDTLPSKELDAQVTFCMFTALMWRRPSVIGPWMDRARRLLENTPGIEKYSALSASLAHLFTWTGDLPSAEKYSTILKTGAEADDAPPLLRLIFYATRSQLGWTRGDAEKTLAVVEHGLSISKETGVRVFDAAFLGSGVYSSFIMGDLRRAEHYLDEMAPLVANPDNLMRANYLFQRAQLVRMKGDLAKAWSLLKEGLEVKGLKGSPYPECLLSCGAAEILHALGKESEANGYLNRVKHLAGEMGSFVLYLFAHLCESQFEFDQGHEEAAYRALGQALSTAQERGIYYFAWWIPTAMSRLCTKALDRKIEVEYVQELIKKTGLIPDGAAATSEAWPWPVKIYTLGGFEIHLDGKPLPRRRKAPYQILRLLKAIIALGGDSVPVSRLIDTLWPDAEGDTGQENLHKSLQRLRRLLGHETFIHVREAKISLNRQVCWVDAMAFQALLEGEEGMTNRRNQSRSELMSYEQALVLYRGPFLGNDGSDLWADQRRERLRHQFVTAVEAITDRQMADRDEEGAVSCLRKALKSDPLSEPLYPKLFNLLRSTGRQSEAKLALFHYRQALTAAGREPSMEMQRLSRGFSSS